MAVIIGSLVRWSKSSILKSNFSAAASVAPNKRAGAGGAGEAAELPPAGSGGAGAAVAGDGGFHPIAQQVRGQDAAFQGAQQGAHQDGADAGFAVGVAPGSPGVRLTAAQPGQAPFGQGRAFAKKQINVHKVPPFRMREAGIKIPTLTAEAVRLQGERPEK